MAATMIPEPHYIHSEQDFIDFINDIKKSMTLDKVATNAGLNRHTIRKSFENGSAGKLSSIIAVCKSMGYDIIIARDRSSDKENSLKPTK